MFTLPSWVVMPCVGGVGIEVSGMCAKFLIVCGGVELIVSFLVCHVVSTIAPVIRALCVMAVRA